MSDQPTPADRPCSEHEREILYKLTDGDEPIWSVDDLGRAIEDATGVVDGIAELLCAGLIHKTSDGYVFATHAGYKAVEMIGASV